MGLMMKNVKTLALAATAVAAMSGNAYAADRSDLHASDYKWMQFNLMYSIGEKPDNPASGDQHNYLEMEFGGRSGIFDLYGYVDVFNLGNQYTTDGDKNPGSGTSKIFMKFAPRISMDAVFNKDLSFGPVQEVYFSTLFNWDGLNGDGVNSSFWGVGADVMVPWLGKTGMNLYAFYDLNEKEWNGYQFSMNWFKPFTSSTTRASCRSRVTSTTSSVLTKTRQLLFLRLLTVVTSSSACTGTQIVTLWAMA